MYSTPEDVIEATGVTPNDLSLDSDEDLEALIDKWLIEIADLINADRRRDFLAEAGGDPSSVRPLVRSVAKRMASNMVALAVLRRDTPIIQIGDFNIKMVEDRILTEDIRRDLGQIPRGRTDVTPFRFWRMRNKRQIEEA